MDLGLKPRFMRLHDTGSGTSVLVHFSIPVFWYKVLRGYLHCSHFSGFILVLNQVEPKALALEPNLT